MNAIKQPRIYDIDKNMKLQKVISQNNSAHKSEAQYQKLFEVTND